MNNGKICVSVCAETAEEFDKKILEAEKIGDLVELRFDCLSNEEFEKLEFKQNDDFIFTFRPKEQGGKRNLTLKEREDFWNSGYDFCGADFEEDVVENHLYWLYMPVICSFHDFQKVPENLFQIYERILSSEANIDFIKIAVQANEITDSLAIWKFLEKAKSENKQLIPIAMGEAGKWTRILGLAFGSPLTYASLEEGNETASGQISAKDLIEVYRVKELNEKTEIYGIIGNPVSQSLSPYMHNAAFKHHNLNAVYIPFEVSNLDEFIKRMVRVETREIEWNLKGFSVTIPHKQAIMKHLDFVDEDAINIGAVNTVKIVDGKLYGYNTDAHGFIEPLKNFYGDLSNTNVGIIGNGGAARACIYALKKENANVTIFARNLKNAENLGKDFDVKLELITNRKSQIANQNILVNTTPIGMKGELENQTPTTAENLKNLHLVYDLVYNPFETLLMREAKSVGVPTIGGLAMLVAQGMKQLEIWTELEAPMKIMSRAALQKLSRR